MAMTDVEEAIELRSKYTHFRILVIGRANAGKTTLLKRVCNTLDEPCIFDEESKNLLEPTSERGIHDIHRPFAFASNPQFIFHDSPGFEAGGEKELHEVQSFIEKRARSTEVKDQLHAIWFCIVTDGARPLLGLETKFFNEKRAGNVPVIAIFTKFDDLINQVYNEEKEEEENRELASKLLDEGFRKPLSKYNFPPQADVYIEGIHENEADHQGQVKELISLTANALDSLALKMLFVSVQQNNLELCIKFAIYYSPLMRRKKGQPTLLMKELVATCLQWFRHSYYNAYDYGKTEDDLDKLMIEIQQKQLLLQNIVSVTMLINQTFPNLSLAALSAILICLNNSFWCTSQSTAFINAFHQAWQLYIQSPTRIKVESAILALGFYPATYKDQKIFNSSLLSIILKHCLSHGDPSQSSN